MAKKPIPTHWFAIKASFTCPSCGKLSEETMYSGAYKPDPGPVAAAIQKQDLTCRLCKVRPADETPIALNVLPVTLAEAKTAGFKPHPSLGI